MRALLPFALSLLAACGSSAAAPITVSVPVFSGRPQPEAAHTSVAVGTPILLQLEGLGPPHADVTSPNGERVQVEERPLVRDGKTIGTEARFVASIAGSYRVELVEARGQPLAFVDAR